MRITVVTLFPGFFRGPLDSGILGRAVQSGRVAVETVDLRPFGEGRHRTTDDYPFGGGAGMLMKAGPVVDAMESVQADRPGCRVTLLSPQGRRFDQGVARQYATQDEFVLICGRYEGFDERIREFADDELSVGDVVIMGGEAAALVVVEAVARLVPGVLGDERSPDEESHAEGLLEYPQYTRPRSFRGREVPPVLLSGNHAEIEAWRRREAVVRTARRRPDLIDGADLTAGEREIARRVADERIGDP